jgi:hypothetical protein
VLEVVVERWLLVETFSGPGHDPTVIALGQVAKRMLPLSAVIGRGGYIAPVRAMIERAAATGEPFRGTTRDGRRHLIADPLVSYAGEVNGVYAYFGPAAEDVPPRAPAGAWYFNRSTGKIGGSDGLLDLYGMAPDDRRRERFTAEAFTRLRPGPDETEALAILIHARPGEEFRGERWGVHRDDGELRSVSLWARVVETARPGDQPEVVVRGITQDTGPARVTPSGPASITVAQRVLMAEREPGKHRAIVDLRSLTLLRWVESDPPMPGIAWEIDARYRPAIHPADLRKARDMSSQLATADRVEGVVRLRGTHGGWVPVAVTAVLVLMDTHTTAALVTLSSPPGDAGPS